MSEEVKTAEEQQKNDEITPRNDEIVEVSWESPATNFSNKACRRSPRGKTG